MDSITQECRSRQAIIGYSYKKGIFEIMELYEVSRIAIYR